MSDYYHASATIQAPPRHSGSPEKTRTGQTGPQRPTTLNEGTPPRTQGALGSARPEPASVQRQPQKPPHAKLSDPDEPRGTDLRPAPVNPTLRQRCQGCEKILRRLLPLILLFFYTFLGAGIFHWCEKVQPGEVEAVQNVDLVKVEPVRVVQVEQRPPINQLVDDPSTNRTFVLLNRRFHEIVLDRNYTRLRQEYEVREALHWYLRELEIVMRNRTTTTQQIQVATSATQLAEERTQRNVTQERSHWDFVSALFYAVSVYTTIGYGKPAPATKCGQVWTVIYALIGIPLAITALMQLAYVLAKGFWKLWSCIRHGRRRSTRSHGAEWQAIPTELETRLQEERDDLDALTFPLTALIILLIIFMLIIAALFMAWESPHWSYGKSFYFTFQSLSTIGLGDNKPQSGWSKLLGAVFLILGLALLLTILAFFLYQMDALYRSLERSIESEYREALTDTGEPMPLNRLAIDDALKRMASRLPFASRFLYWLMPESRKKSLRKLYKTKASLANRGMQTDDYLWAMTPTVLKTIGEGVEGVHDDEKSRDDVNSLVAMCDYSLKPQYRGTKLEY